MRSNGSRQCDGGHGSECSNTGVQRTSLAPVLSDDALGFSVRAGCYRLQQILGRIGVPLAWGAIQPIAPSPLTGGIGVQCCPGGCSFDVTRSTTGVSIADWVRQDDTDEGEDEDEEGDEDEDRTVNASRCRTVVQCLEYNGRLNKARGR